MASTNEASAASVHARCVWTGFKVKVGLGDMRITARHNHRRGHDSRAGHDGACRAAQGDAHDPSCHQGEQEAARLAQALNSLEATVVSNDGSETHVSLPGIPFCPIMGHLSSHQFKDAQRKRFRAQTDLNDIMPGDPPVTRVVYIKR